MAGDPKNAGADRGDVEEVPVKPAEKPVEGLKRTVSSTQIMASDILAQLQKKSSRPPKALTEEDEKKDEEKK